MPEIERKTIPSSFMAGIRGQGKYQECGQLFKRLGKQFAFQICGPAFLLYYDEEFKKDDADFEACLSIRRGAGNDTMSVREFPGRTLPESDTRWTL